MNYKLFIILMISIMFTATAVHAGPMDKVSVIVVLKNPLFDYSEKPTVRLLKDGFEEVASEFLEKYNTKIEFRKKLFITSGIYCRMPEYMAESMENDTLVREVIPLFKSKKYTSPKPREKDNKSQPPYTSWILKHVKFNEVHDLYGLHGRNIIVGVIDSGIDTAHPYLKDKVLKFRDFINQREEPYDDTHHGTFISGIIAGGPRVGTASKIKLIVAKAINSYGHLPVIPAFEAMGFMADPDNNPETKDNPVLLNCSFSCKDNKDRMFYQALLNLKRLGTLTICPTKPDGSAGAGTPAGYPHVISVGATSTDNSISYFSGYGISPFDHRPKPKLVAPGEWVFSTTVPPYFFTMKDGAEYACPFVTGQLALMLSVKPDLKIEELEKNLLDNCLFLGSHKSFGKGLIQPFNSVTTLLNPVDNTIRTYDENKILTESLVSIKALTPPYQDFEYTSSEKTLKLGHGEYELRIKNFGYEDIVRKITGLEKELNINLIPVPRVSTSIKLINKNGEPLIGLICFSTEPGTNKFEINGNTFLPLKRGVYKTFISSYGYEPQELRFEADEGKNYVITMNPLPATLLVDDDLKYETENIISEALQDAGIKHRIYDPHKEGNVNAVLLSQYENVYWFMGPLLSQRLTESDMEAIKTYMESGGNIIITGQDIAYKAQHSAFLREVLGSVFIRDNSIINEIYGSEDYSDFSHIFSEITQSGYSSGQLTCDVIKRGPECDNAREIVYYGPKDGFRPGAAIVFNNTTTGRSFFSSFGLEGLTDPKMRIELITQMFDMFNQYGSNSEIDSLMSILENFNRTKILDRINLKIVKTKILQRLSSLPMKNRTKYINSVIEKIEASGPLSQRILKNMVHDLKARVIMER